MKINKFILLFSCLPFVVVADSFSIRLENDHFYDDDSDYTHGTELSWMSNKSLWKFDNYGISIQQNMYTPDKINRDYYQDGDRPYCGYLALNFIGDNYYSLLDNFIITIRNELSIGTIGPASLAGDTQRLIHKWLGCKKPHWEFQLDNKLMIEYQSYLNFDYKFIDYNGFYGVVTPNIGLALGNFKDFIDTGLDFKVGYNYNPSIGSDKLLSANRLNHKLYLLVGFDGYYIMHDETLSDFTYNNIRYSVNEEDWVNEFHYGIGMSLLSVDFNWILVEKSKEYSTQDEKSNYGIIFISYNSKF